MKKETRHLLAFVGTLVYMFNWGVCDDGFAREQAKERSQRQYEQCMATTTRPTGPAAWFHVDDGRCLPGGAAR